MFSKLDIVARIEAAMKAKKLPATRFAEAMGGKESGYSKDTVGIWRKNQSSSYMNDLQKIADLLDVTVRWLLTGEEPQKRQENKREGIALDKLPVYYDPKKVCEILEVCLERLFFKKKGERKSGFVTLGRNTVITDIPDYSKPIEEKVQQFFLDAQGITQEIFNNLVALLEKNESSRETADYPVPDLLMLIVISSKQHISPSKYKEFRGFCTELVEDEKAWKESQNALKASGQ